MRKWSGSAGGGRFFVYFFLGLCLATTLLLNGLIAAEVRTWTDSTGRNKTEAEFVSYVDGKVTLRKPGTDKTVTLPIDRLSDEDQAYVEDLVDAQEEAESEASEESNVNRPRTRPNNFTNSVRGAPVRDQTKKQLRQLGLAILNHEAATQRIPPSGTQVNGKPGLSWRVRILPYIEQNGLYRQFRLNEPWDSEHNLKLVDKMPKIFVSPGSDLPDGYTNFQGIVNDESVMQPVGGRGSRLRDIRDGTSKTMLLVEVDDTEATIWTKPDDYEWDRSKPTAGLGNIWPGYFLTVFVDGSVHQIPVSVGDDTLNGLMTKSGGERVSLDN